MLPMNESCCGSRLETLVEEYAVVCRLASIRPSAPYCSYREAPQTPEHFVNGKRSEAHTWVHEYPSAPLRVGSVHVLQTISQLRRGVGALGASILFVCSVGKRWGLLPTRRHSFSEKRRHQQCINLLVAILEPAFEAGCRPLRTADMLPPACPLLLSKAIPTAATLGPKT